MHQKHLLPTLTAVLLLAVQTGACAAELGEPVVKSHIGQPLVADIELLPSAGGLVRASMAHEDVYRGASIDRSPVLDTLHLSVMRRDGRQFLHITSIRPVEKNYLHLFLDLDEDGKSDIRAATLWLTPEPPAPVRPAMARRDTPAPAPAPAPKTPEPRSAKRMSAPAPVPDTTCLALDYKNAQLAAQVVDLEEKIKALQYAVDMQGGRPAPAPVARPKVVAPAPALQAETASLPMYAGIGAGVLALAGAGGWMGWRRRARTQTDETATEETAPSAPDSSDAAE